MHFYDVTKILELLPHNLLFEELMNIGITGKPLYSTGFHLTYRIGRNYTTNILYDTKIAISLSRHHRSRLSPIIIQTGDSQGSNVRPMLFLNFIND